MRNAWVTDEGAASVPALDQEAGDVHAPSFLEKSISAAEPQPAPRLFSRYKDPEDMALPIVVHHERTSFVGPEQPGAIRHSAARIDSTTMTDLDLVAPTEPALSPSRTCLALRTQFSVNQSALVRPDSSPVMEPEVSVLPPALEELRGDIFMPSPSPRPSWATSTTATAPSTTDTVPSTIDTAPDTDSGSEDRRGQKQAAPSLDTSYSQEHRATIPGPSNYPERHFRRRLLTLLSWGPVLSAATLITILGLPSSCPTMIANSFILFRGYRTARVHNRVTAYDRHTSRCDVPSYIVPKDPSLRPPLLRKEEESCLAGRVVA